MMEMPPPAPWAVEMGIPARPKDSMSLWMVRRDTSNCSASSGGGDLLPLEQDGQNADEPLHLQKLHRLSCFYLYYITRTRQLSVIFLFTLCFL